MAQYGGNRYILRFPKGDDHIATMIRRSGRFYEEALLEAIRKRRLEGVYVDVGAHVGNHSVFFAAECPSTEVIAIESDPQTFALLQHNTRSLRVKLHNVAALDREGTVSIRRADPHNSGMNRVTGGADIRACSLDALVDGPVALLKLDVEGCEIKALRGAAALLEGGPVLSIEARTPAEQAALEALLHPLGYRVQGKYNYTPTYLWGR